MPLFFLVGVCFCLLGIALVPKALQPLTHHAGLPLAFHSSPRNSRTNKQTALSFSPCLSQMNRTLVAFKVGGKHFSRYIGDHSNLRKHHRTSNSEYFLFPFSFPATFRCDQLVVFRTRNLNHHHHSSIPTDHVCLYPSPCGNASSEPPRTIL